MKPRGHCHSKNPSIQKNRIGAYVYSLATQAMSSDTVSANNAHHDIRIVWIENETPRVHRSCSSRVNICRVLDHLFPNLSDQAVMKKYKPFVDPSFPNIDGSSSLAALYGNHQFRSHSPESGCTRDDLVLILSAEMTDKRR